MKALARIAIVLALMFGMAAPMVGCEDKEPTPEEQMDEMKKEVDGAMEKAKEDGQEMMDKAKEDMGDAAK